MFHRVLVSAALAVSTSAATPPPATKPPSLVVLIVIDQLRGDELEKHDALLRYGLRRLRDEGRWYARAMHSHGRTETAAGHASIATGLTPRWHGIINKTLYERGRGATLGVCDYGPGPCSPAPLLEKTLSERLEELRPDSTTIALGQKARSAMLLGGRRADIVAWMSEETLHMVGRSAGADRVPEWLDRYWRHVAGPDRVSRIWELPRLPPPYSGWRDDAPGELDMGAGLTFPHRLPPLTNAKAFYGAWSFTPDCDRALVETAQYVVGRMRLGSDAAPDLLQLSFSGFDAIGHAYGPDSLERVAALVELDRMLGDLLSSLEEIPGVLVALTSDHGVAPLPERTDKESGRLDPAELVSIIEAALARESGETGPFVEAAIFPFFYLRTTDEEALAAAARALEAHPHVQRAFTKSELASSNDPLAALMRESAHLERSGEIVAVLRPYWSTYSQTRGKRLGGEHGSPWPYDRHVPVILWGEGVTAGRVDAEVKVIDLTRTLADRLGLAPDPRGGAPLP